MAAFQKLSANTELGGFTEECLHALKLIVSFAQEGEAVEKYHRKAAVAKDIAAVSNRWASMFFGLVRIQIFGFFAYSYYASTKFVENRVLNPSTGKPYVVDEVVAVTQAMIISLMTTLNITTHVTNVAQAKICAKKVIDILNRVPAISDKESQKNEEKAPISLTREIKFDKVHFRYPTSPDSLPDTLRGVNFVIKAGTSTAIVGPSGSGKSTIVQMLERYYDPQSGTISFDDRNLMSIPLTQLRTSIGYVAQEPVLILGSIRDNLLFANKDATQSDMEAALKKANAEFVKQLENGLDTYIGSSAIQNLSGGQK